MAWYRPPFPFVLAAWLLLASGCALTPVLDRHTQAQLAQIHVLPIAEREGQLLKAALIEHLDPEGLNPPPLYDLDLTVQVAVSNAVGSSARIHRARGTFTATGRLIAHDGTQLWSGTVSRASLLALSELPSLSRAAQEDLWQDLADLVARDIRLQLAQVLRKP